MPFVVLGAISVLVIIYFIGSYNKLVTLKNNAKNAWAQIDVQLKRRYDLIPNLVEIVKGYSVHEKETLENVIKARNTAISASTLEQKANAENMLTKALEKISLVVENYPELKANENYLALQEELTSTENKIAFSRQSYNDQVLFYNTSIEKFPTNILANTVNYKLMFYFEVSEVKEKQSPIVKF